MHIVASQGMDVLDHYSVGPGSWDSSRASLLTVGLGIGLDAHALNGRHKCNYHYNTTAIQEFFSCIAVVLHLNGLLYSWS